MEEIEAVGMRCCGSHMEGWVAFTFFLARASISRASSSLSSSTREPPTLCPRALRKVKTMPPLWVGRWVGGWTGR